MTNKDYRNKKCCLNCKNFVWWDGDYCCVSDMKIHQYGFGNQNGGYLGTTYMNEDIDNTMQTPETCDDYEHTFKNIYINLEYSKFKEYQEMINNYNKFIK